MKDMTMQSNEHYHDFRKGTKEWNEFPPLCQVLEVKKEWNEIARKLFDLKQVDGDGELVL